MNSRTRHGLELRPRSAVLAASLSLVVAGVGQVYVGRWKRGAWLFATTAITLPLAWAGMKIGGQPGVLLGFAVPVLLVPGVHVYAAFDAWRTARRVTSTYLEKPCNHATIYALMLTAGLIYPALIVHAIRSDVMQIFAIPEASGSMAPVIDSGDRVLVSKIDPHAIAIGDVVVFRAPDAEGVHYVKRVVAVAGDHFEIRDNRAYRNGERLGGDDRAEGPDVPRLEVPAGACYLLGDNRNNSKDSRHFGCIAVQDVIGRATRVIFPLSRWSSLDR